MYQVEITLSNGGQIRKIYTWESEALAAQKRVEEMVPGVRVRVNYMG